MYRSNCRRKCRFWFCRGGERQCKESDAEEHQRQEKFCACFHHGSFSLSEKSQMGKARRRAQNKKCAAGRLRTKNAGLHLLRHKLCVSKDKSAKNETAFLPKMCPYFLKQYLFVSQEQYSISFRKMQFFCVCGGRQATLCGVYIFHLICRGDSRIARFYLGLAGDS